MSYWRGQVVYLSKREMGWREDGGNKSVNNWTLNSPQLEAKVNPVDRSRSCNQHALTASNHGRQCKVGFCGVDYFSGPNYCTTFQTHNTHNDTAEFAM